MAKSNGKPFPSTVNLDIEHELPPGDGDGATEQARPEAPAASAQDELQKVRSERDALFERLARQQAEFENYRKRAGREQQDFRDYALADALKSIATCARQLRARAKECPSRERRR